jgi:hypothetical protein
MNKAINDLASAVLLQTGKEYALDRDIDAKDGNTFNDQIPLELKNALQTILNNSPDGINTFKVFDFNDEVTLEDSAIENDLQEAE